MLKGEGVRRVGVIDSHTGGEPTRIVVEGGPDLGGGSVAERAQIFGERHDHFRRAVVNEPRGSDVLVGGLVVEPEDVSCAVGVIFFNNVGVLGMCGHGTIGLVTTLAYMGRIGVGAHRIETSVGVVTATLSADGSVSVENVDSFRKALVEIVLECGERVRGEVVWSGNWFFLVDGDGEDLVIGRVAKLTERALQIRAAIHRAGYPEVDHIEIGGGALGEGGDARNFVLCPGGAYDRSPCGTGTSAKLAGLAADGQLLEGEEWVQESIIGSRFRGAFRWVDREGGVISPTITGRAYVIAEASLLLDPSDPFCWGIG